MKYLLETITARPQVTVLAVVLLGVIITLICVLLERRVVKQAGLDIAPLYIPSWVINGLYMPTMLVFVLTKSFPMFQLFALQTIVIAFAKQSELKKRNLPESVMRVYRITTPIETIAILGIFTILFWKEYNF